MIVYMKCASCKTADRILYARLRAAGHDVRVVNRNVAYRTEANQYGHPLPFGVKGKKAVPFEQVTY